MLAATAALAGGPEALPLSTLGSPKQEGVSALTYPATRVLPLVEEKFGQKVADPYRWLENDVRTDREVEDWVAAENRATDSYLATLPGRQILKDRMKALFNYERYSVPRKASSLYFYARNSGLQNQSPLYVREGLGGKARLLIDPNSWAKDGTTALAEWEPSPDGRKLVYAVQDGGSDWRTLHVIDVATGSVLPDRIEWVKFSRLEWDRAGEGFFYSRFPAPEQGREYLNADLNNTVYYHRLGTDQSADRLVYRTPAHPKWNHAAQVSDDGQWLVITTSEGTDPRYEIVAINLADPKWKPRTIVSGMKNEWKFVGSVASRMWFVTDLGAPRSRLVTLDAARRGRAPQEIVPQRADTLAGASLVGRRIILAYMSNAQSVVEMVELDGKLVGPIPLPGIGTAAGFGGKAGDPETFFSFSGFTTPGTIYRFNTDNQAVEEFARPRLAFNPDDYEEEQLFYASKDGTKVPMFIVRKKSLARALTPAPTLLYGYGGFNISILPGYSAMRMAWLEQGGVIAVANLRGGGEYGREWHEAGRLANKQNVFDDFIAAGEYLIDNHYTGKDQLAIEGRSNGGLLVGAVVNQRPDLFAAALPAVGVMDMLRFDQFTAGRYWVDDYGYPDREADFNILRGYSPYHNIRSGVDYPAILVTTADTDDRVVPGHSFKYAAALQAARIGPKPHLIRIETRAGHGSGKPTDKLIDEYADSYAFLARWTGLEVAPIPRN
ncbi:MAG: prolyl oligopeptidase family serine peptidase [Sphingobium sp.]|jgi:prolyl oligopeptidase|nr:prolyl oligopeptidase family serine peptidase [Sphingobium sp.]MCI1272202.1 prolyl oligopeptidase family serine peptidase [Sphingobium sp.]MCI1756577.1 prolyl oligopeptidase family serine peptidase [Sphingobium sp.]MCI2053797.1 prolyl oligopeptidase family serine peptidase [Sphingobium sp.]